MQGYYYSNFMQHRYIGFLSTVVDCENECKVFEKSCEGYDEPEHSIIDNETLSCEIGLAV